MLLLTETNLDWDEVIRHLEGCRLFLAAQNGLLPPSVQNHPGLTVLEIDPGPTPTQERVSLALLEAVRTNLLHSGAHVVTLYNGIEIGTNRPSTSTASA